MLVKIEGVGYILLSTAKSESGNITRNTAVQSFSELSYSMHYVEHRFTVCLRDSRIIWQKPLTQSPWRDTVNVHNGMIIMLDRTELT